MAPDTFLSIQAQDFIEEQTQGRYWDMDGAFLSIQAQDFIEERCARAGDVCRGFLSIQAQDFIEETVRRLEVSARSIPEHSSSGLH